MGMDARTRLGRVTASGRTHFRVFQSVRAGIAAAGVAACFTIAPGAARAGNAPVIDTIAASVPSVAPGGVVTISIQAHDPDCTGGTCTTECGAYIRADLTLWSEARGAGTFVSLRNGASSSPYAAAADWQAPAAEGTYSLSVSLSDSGTWMCGGRLSTTGRVDVLVTSSTNRPPTVSSVTATPARLLGGQSSALGCVASDPDGDALSYSWSTDSGSLAPNGPSASFSGSQPGVATVTCTVTDTSGASGTGSANVVVAEALPSSRIHAGLGAPLRVSADSLGDVYVADRDQIAALNLADGSFVHRIPFEGVRSVAVDWQNRLLVGGRTGAGVFDRTGGRLLTLEPGEPLGPAVDVAVDAPRRRYAVLHGDASRIVVYGESGARVAAFGTPGDATAELRRPQGIAFTPAGDLVVADSGQAMVKVLGTDGALRLAFGGNGTSAGRFVRLDDVEVGADGVIYASDSFQSWVQAFNPEGTLRDVVGTYGTAPGEFETPSGVAVVADACRLVVASVNTPSLEVFTLRGSPVGVRTPQPLVTPVALAFQSTPVGAASPVQVARLSNTGTAPLGIHGVVVNGEFRQTNDCGPFLDPGRSCAFAVDYAPETPGVATGALVIETSGSPRTLAVSLSGQGVLSPAATLAPSRLAFGEQKVGTTSAPRSLTLTNTGAVNLSITGVLVSEAFGAAASCGALLPVGQACGIAVTFAPRALGPVEGTLTVDSTAGPLVARLAGVGVASGLEAHPAELDFGSRPANIRGRPLQVTITNVGPEPIGIRDVRATGPGAASFGAKEESCHARQLAVGHSCRAGVWFRPVTTGTFAGFLTVVTSAGDGIELVPLRGIGVEGERRELIFSDDFETGDLSRWTIRTPEEASIRLGEGDRRRLDLGEAMAGSRRVVRVRLVNDLDATVDVTGVTLGQQRDDAFVLETDADHCSGARLATGDGCTVHVLFAPRAAGSFSATVELETSAGKTGLVLAGEGQPLARKAP